MGQLGLKKPLPILTEDNPPYRRKLVILGCWSPHPWLHDTQDQAHQHERDEAAYRKDSLWRYNDILDG